MECIKINCPAKKTGKSCRNCTNPIPDSKDAERRRRELKRQRDEFERNNATDSFGNCFSDADPGL